MRYGMIPMHGLRCSPALLGWTRLLDEWVVGLTDFDRTYADEPTCWDDPAHTQATLVSAARRVVAFALGAGDADPIVVHPDGFVGFELQGLRYVVATDQLSPTSAYGLDITVRDALDAASARAGDRVHGGQIGVGAVFVTPVLEPSEAEERRWARTEPFLRTTHGVASSGCAYSFPSAHEMRRFHYTNDTRPGAILTVLAHAEAGSIST